MRALGFSSFTVTDTLDELKTMIRDAVSCHFDATLKTKCHPPSHAQD